MVIIALSTRYRHDRRLIIIMWWLIFDCLLEYYYFMSHSPGQGHSCPYLQRILTVNPPLYGLHSVSRSPTPRASAAGYKIAPGAGARDYHGLYPGSPASR